MLLWSLLISMIVLALGVWLAASSGRPTDFAGTVACCRQNFRLWHLGAIVGAVFFAWLFTGLTASAGTASKLNGYKQFINGALVSANVKKIDCHEDGSCRYTHDCDSYQVKVVDQAAYTDDNGDYHSEKYHYETRYHHCPYVTEEYVYSVTAWYGFEYVDYTVPDGNHDFALHPQIWHSDPGSWFLSEGHHYHTSHGIPSGVFEGVPPDWKAYHDDIARGDSDPATGKSTYVNYTLASKDPVLTAYSDKVPDYLKRGLLPDHTAGMLKGDPIKNLIDADKMSFVGFSPPNAQLWEARLMRFNAALGITLQGDLHIVAVSDKLVPSGQSEDYLNTLKAYWQGPKFGKKALAKNGIIVALGVNAATDTIDWARAATGMPVGNGEMVSAITYRLPGKPFVPGTILGKIKSISVPAPKGDPTLKFQHGNSLLDRIIFHDFPFKRARMGKHKGDTSGGDFTYLKGDVTLPGWVAPVDIILAILIGLASTAFVVCTSPGFSRYYASSSY